MRAFLAGRRGGWPFYMSKWELTGVGMAAGQSALKKTKTAARLASGEVSGTVTTPE